MEATLIPSLNIPYVGIKMEGINRKKILNNIKVIEELSIACKEVENILTSFNPDNSNTVLAAPPAMIPVPS